MVWRIRPLWRRSLHALLCRLAAAPNTRWFVLSRIPARINDALYHAIHRLDGVWCTEERDVRFVVSEIAGDGRRHWHYSPTNNQFLAGLGPS